MTAARRHHVDDQLRDAPSSTARLTGWRPSRLRGAEAALLMAATSQGATGLRRILDGCRRPLGPRCGVERGTAAENPCGSIRLSRGGASSHPADGCTPCRQGVLRDREPRPRRPVRRGCSRRRRGIAGHPLPAAIPRRTVLLFCHIYLSQTVPEKLAAIIWKPREWQRSALQDIRDQPRSVVSAAPGNGCQSLALAVCACVLAGDSWVRSCRNRRGPHVIPIVRANLPRHVLSSAECSMQRS